MKYKIAMTEDDIRKLHFVKHRVFVEGQGVPYHKVFDKYDKDAIHILVLNGDRAIGAGRIVDKGKKLAKMGMISVLKTYRGKGIGIKIIKYLEKVSKQKGFKNIMMNSQEYVKGFYEKFGYKVKGRVFMEAGIRHVRMEKKL